MTGITVRRPDDHCPPVMAATCNGSLESRLPVFGDLGLGLLADRTLENPPLVILAVGLDPSQPHAVAAMAASRMLLDGQSFRQDV
jgi:hypothetical protein